MTPRMFMTSATPPIVGPAQHFGDDGGIEIGAGNFKPRRGGNAGRRKQRSCAAAGSATLRSPSDAVQAMHVAELMRIPDDRSSRRAAPRLRHRSAGVTIELSICICVSIRPGETKLPVASTISAASMRLAGAWTLGDQRPDKADIGLADQAGDGIEQACRRRSGCRRAHRRARRRRHGREEPDR